MREYDLEVTCFAEDIQKATTTTGGRSLPVVVYFKKQQL